MKNKLLLITGCSILLLCTCGNNVSVEDTTTEDVPNTEYIQETEIETEMEPETQVVADIEETVASTDSVKEENESLDINDNTSEEGNTGVETPTDVTLTPNYSVEDRDGDGYADLGPTTEFNGFLMPTEQVTVDTAKLYQAVCNAGYYNPVYWNNGCTYMIVPDGEYDKGVDFLINYATQNGMPLNSLGGGNWDMMRVADFVYMD